MPATLRDLHADGTSFIASCSNWRGSYSHRGDVSIDNLIRHLGWDFSYVEGGSRMLELLVCSECGANRPESQLNNSLMPAAGSNGHSLSPIGVAPPPGVVTSTMAEHIEGSRTFRAEHPTPPLKYGGRGRRRFR